MAIHFFQRLIVFGGDDDAPMEILSTDSKQWVSKQQTNLLNLVRPHMQGGMVDAEHVVITGGGLSFVSNRVCSI